MSTFELKKKCEVCEAPLPDDFMNLLCYEHYGQLETEISKKRGAVLEEEKKDPESPVNPVKTETIAPIKTETPVAEMPVAIPTDPKFGVKDPNYKENPEMEDKDQILANLAQFIYTHRGTDHPKGKKHGILLYYPQRNMYNFVKNYCMKKVTSHPQYPKQIWKPKIVDIGCGSGVGTNILSQESDMVWGIDKNEFSVEFAKEAFTREKNQIYYSSQITFDLFDVMTDNRLVMEFDVVTAIEVIEHIYDTDKFLRSLWRFARKDKKGNYRLPNATEFFISTPNRNNPKIRKDRPENLFHVREWTSQEIKELLLKYFENVELMNQKGEPTADDTIEQVVLVKCSIPKQI